LTEQGHCSHDERCIPKPMEEVVGFWSIVPGSRDATTEPRAGLMN
jgi:hypothetical protein